MLGLSLLTRRLSLSAAARAAPSASSAALASLESLVAGRSPSRALAALDALPAHEQLRAPQLLQRLALLVAKRGQPHEAPRAARILRSLLGQSQFSADDATQLAALYALDGCLRTRRLEDALLLVDAMQKKDVLVDLPSVDALLCALVDARRVDDASSLLQRVTKQKDIRPTEETFQPVLYAVMRQRRYGEVMTLLELGRHHQVEFTPQTYDPLVELSQQQYKTEDVERLGTFMEYVNDALREDGYWAHEEDDEEDDDDDEEEDFDDDDFDDEFDEDLD